MANAERELDVTDLVVEVDARGTPHHDLFRPVALEELDGALAHARSRGGVALLVVDDSAAVARAADGYVVEAEPVEDRRDGLHEVRRPQHVAAEVEHDRAGRRVAVRNAEIPRALVAPRGQIVERLDLAEVALVVEGHLAETIGRAGRRELARTGSLP
ncbi:MAG TPA: hypothetical protein VMW19_18095 [Myxococcota bacterium]|nr:hypothetical protein [Myxococcota bacterium]